jgi:hypothetical protein
VPTQDLFSRGFNSNLRSFYPYKSLISTGEIHLVVATLVFNSSLVTFPSFSQFAAHLHNWSSVHMSTLYEPKDDADEDATDEKYTAPVHRSGING